MTPNMKYSYFCDSHCHLASEPFEGDLQETLERAESAGVQSFVTIGAGEEFIGNEKAVELSNRYENIYATLGIHPHDAKIWSQKTWDALKEFTVPTNKMKKIVAWGEIGLDYHYMNSEKDVQIRAFVEQIHIAYELNLPIVIHTREAEEDTLKFFRLHENKIHRMDIHCFSGSQDFAEALETMGAYLGIGGVLTFNSAKNIRKSVSNYPTSRLLLETDCPYLAPVPHRGQRNEPGYIPAIAKKLAELKEMTVDEIAKITTQNACEFFGI